MATSAEWHEDYDRMSKEALNFSRAIKSVHEELEAVDYWYDQRAQATDDEQLRRRARTLPSPDRRDRPQPSRRPPQWRARPGAPLPEKA